jgi:hypothetical protein
LKGRQRQKKLLYVWMMIEEEEVVDGGEKGSFIEGEGGWLISKSGRGASAVREAVEGGWFLPD